MTSTAARPHWLLEQQAKGRAVKAVARAAEEQTKLGLLRGGNAGAIIDGEVYGKCHRVSYLRTLGLEAPASKPNMLEAGMASEELVAASLLAAGLKVVGNQPVEWDLGDGVRVSGRPDLVVTGSSGDAGSVGVELKLACSIWTVRGVHYDLQPKSAHLIQAATYSLMTGLPFVLWYRSQVEFHLSTAPKWLTSKFGKGGPWDYDVEYNDKGEPLKLVPFDRVYDLAWDTDGCLTYTTQGLPTVRTKLRADDIRTYYRTVASLGTDRDLGPRPTALSIDGSSSYKPCQYCELASVCDRYEGEPFDVWLDHAKVALATGHGLTPTGT